MCVQKALSVEKFISRFLQVILVIKAEVSFQQTHPAQGPNVVVKSTEEIFAYKMA